MSDNNRRGFPKNIGAIIAGTTVATITSTNTVLASAPSVPTFEECYQKVLYGESLTDLEVIIYSSKMNLLAWESDIPMLISLAKTCSSGKEFAEKKHTHFMSENSSIYYWFVLCDGNKNLKNIINVHKYVVNSVLRVSTEYGFDKTIS